MLVFIYYILYKYKLLIQHEDIRSSTRTFKHGIGVIVLTNLHAIIIIRYVFKRVNKNK